MNTKPNDTTPAQHTPTPWIVGLPVRGLYSTTPLNLLWSVTISAETDPADPTSPHGCLVAVAYGRTMQEALANARTIAAAPEIVADAIRNREAAK